MLATEEPTLPEPEHAPRATLLEQWPQNERMRHIPPMSWILQKLDGDVRRRLEKLLVPYSDVANNDPRHALIETELRAVCRLLDRVADVARRGRNNHPPNDVAGRVRWALDHAVANLSAVDADTFGRRFPFQTFERSNAEPLWAAMLAVIEHVHRLTELARTVDRGIDERMYEGLVTLQTPLDTRPIA